MSDLYGQALNQGIAQLNKQYGRCMYPIEVFSSIPLADGGMAIDVLCFDHRFLHAISLRLTMRPTSLKDISQGFTLTQAQRLNGSSNAPTVPDRTLAQSVANFASGLTGGGVGPSAPIMSTVPARSVSINDDRLAYPGPLVYAPFQGIARDAYPPLPSAANMDGGGPRVGGATWADLMAAAQKKVSTGLVVGPDYTAWLIDANNPHRNLF